MHWSEKEAKKHNLPKRCDELLGSANDHNGAHMEQCLIEALAPQNLQISMLKNERARVISEMKKILSENADSQALKTFEYVLERLNMNTHTVHDYKVSTKHL